MHNCYAVHATLPSCRFGMLHSPSIVRLLTSFSFMLFCSAAHAHAHAVSAGVHYERSINDLNIFNARSAAGGDGYWRSQLIKAGVIDADRPGRPALPLVMFDGSGQRLVLTYGKFPSSDAHSKAVSVILQVPIK